MGLGLRPDSNNPKTLWREMLEEPGGQSHLVSLETSMKEMTKSTSQGDQKLASQVVLLHR